MKIKKYIFLLLSLVIFATGGIFITTENVKACSCAKGSFCLFGGCMTAWATTGSACSQNGGAHICTTDSVSAASHSVCLIGPTGATPCTGPASCVDPLLEGYKYCVEDKCGIYVGGVNEFHTVNDLSSDGDTCRVMEDTFLSCSAPTVGTKWDYKEGKCVNCQAGTNKEISVCGDSTGTYFNGTNCTKAGDNQFESACGADAKCDEQVEGFDCDAGKKCDASGACVAAGISLTVSADPTAMDTISTSDIDFLVEDAGGNPVSGATVTITAVTEAAGTVAVGVSCTTNLAGICPGGLTYGSGLSLGLKTITAEADDGVSPVVSSTVDIMISDTTYQCDITGTKWFDPLIPDVGLCTDLNGDSCGSGEWENCGPCHQSNCPDGTFSSCFSKYQVCGCDCVATPGPGPCISNITCTSLACAEKSPTSAEATETCIDAAVPKCVADTTTAVDCCLKDEHCADPTPVCDTVAERCVECITDADCVGTDICDSNNLCQGCSGEGIDPGSADLCCVGLSYLDIDGDGKFFCTSVCDPNAWFFCNPLRGSVETIVQAGETMLGYILGLIGSIALLFIIIAGMMYMTSAGNEERISSSKKILTGAVIGLMIALLAYGLLHVIMTVLDM